MKLSTKIFIPLIIFLTLVVCTFHFYLMPRIFFSIKAISYQHDNAHIDTVAESLIPLMLENQLANIYELLDALLEKNPTWLSIVLFDANNQRLFPLSEPDEIPVDEGVRHRIRKQIGVDSYVIGHLEIIVDYQPFINNMSEIEEVLETTIFLLSSLLILSTALLLQFTVRRRLQRLTKMTENVAHGLYESDLVSESNDEIGVLSRKFLDMSVQLKKTHELLQNKANDATYLSVHDPLTGIANRREFDLMIEKEWNRARRDQKLIGLMMLDIDHFKLFNDDYGHQAGDKCLKQVAQTIDSTFNRTVDLVARYGGEEFVVLFPEICDCVVNAEKIRSRIEALKIVNRSSPVSEYITVSIGVATMNVEKNNSWSQLLKKADVALYEAKSRGRNQVVFEYFL